jgi:hypothetical protein
LRSQRSTSAPAGRLKRRYGSARKAATMPACVAECVSVRMRSGKARSDTPVPMDETVCPLQRMA